MKEFNEYNQHTEYYDKDGNVFCDVCGIICKRDKLETN